MSDNAFKLTDSFYKKGNEFLGTTIPYICGAMTWVSDPGLVAAVASAGGFASLAAGNAPVEILRKQIEETRRLTDKPFGVNLITIAPMYEEHLKLAQEMNLSHVIFAGSFPRGGEVARVKASGAKVMCFASTLSIAARMVRYGADAIILEGMEAGGHVGHVSLTVLLQQVLFKLKSVPVFVAGGVATGEMCAHLLLMGAAGVQMGTVFVTASECCAHEQFKKSFIRAKARDAISTPQFDSRLPVVAVRALKNKAMESFGELQLHLVKQLDGGTIGRQEAQEKVEEFWMGALRKAVVDGDVHSGSMMSGQSVGLVSKIAPVKEILEELRQDTEKALREVQEKLSLI